MNITKTLKDFKEYCCCYKCPSYIKEYIRDINEDEYYWFYNQIKKAMSYLIDREYLIYKMYWIMKQPWNDLCLELTEQLNFNIEGYDLSKIITDDNFNKLLILYSNEITSILEYSLHQEDIDPL